jgi:hypothetical protein
VTGTAFLVIVPAGSPQGLGVDAQRLSEWECWDTAAVHGWLQAFEDESDPTATVRVVPAAQAELIGDEIPRLEVPVTAEEAALLTQAVATPAAAQAQAELLSFRRMLAQRPGMIARAHAAGLSPAQIQYLGGTSAV